jgi:peptide/nickel transport system substrate-binding protein
MRKLVLLTALLGVLIFVVACAAPTPTPAPKPTEPPKPTVAPTQAPEPTKTPEPTKAPEPTKPAATVAPTAAPAAKPTLTVTLKKGLKWSDGAPFSAKDVVGTYNIFWAQSASAWNFLADVVAKDDYTIDFVMSNPSPIILRAVLRDNFIRPYSVYGQIDGSARRNSAKPTPIAKAIRVKKLLDDLIAFKPDKVVTFGPFMVDPKSITEAQLTLVKNPTGYNADKIGFEKITVYYGDTKESMPLLLAQQLDYSTAAYPEANLKTLEGLKNIQLQPFTTGFGPGLWFNNDVYPLNKKEVRQAFAYILDRDEITKVAVGRGGTTVKMMAGFSDSLVDAWLSKDVQAKLNPYKKDLKKAEELLTKLGFKKGTDGVWVGRQGQQDGVRTLRACRFHRLAGRGAERRTATQGVRHPHHDSRLSIVRALQVRQRREQVSTLD